MLPHGQLKKLSGKLSYSNLTDRSLRNTKARVFVCYVSSMWPLKTAGRDGVWQAARRMGLQS